IWAELCQMGPGLGSATGSSQSRGCGGCQQGAQPALQGPTISHGAGKYQGGAGQPPWHLFKVFIEGWPQVKVFQARPDDLLIATYPKSGTTWLSEVTDMIYHDSDVKKCQRDAIYNRVPFLEMTVPGLPSGVEQLENTSYPRLVKTHLPVQLFPTSFWEKDCKIIYVARDPKDVVISYYYFCQMAKLHPDPGTLAEFLETFMAGKVAYGSWYDHVRGWWEKKQKKILYLFYEDMKKNPQYEVQKILPFLGMEVAEGTVERILHH
ncbi:ST1D1 Sulfotransferase, partial [Neodrepanis coruscans]|nr:ST1D1 Sulfotransferase [Neodrepanis coruscans]